jgi:hypothetical protein
VFATNSIASVTSTDPRRRRSTLEPGVGLGLNAQVLSCQKPARNADCGQDEHNKPLEHAVVVIGIETEYAFDPVRPNNCEYTEEPGSRRERTLYSNPHRWFHDVLLNYR